MSEEQYIQEEGPSQDAEAARHRSPYAADMPGQHMSRHYYQQEEIREETRHSPPDYPFDTTDIYNTPPVAQYQHYHPPYSHGPYYHPYPSPIDRSIKSEPHHALRPRHSSENHYDPYAVGYHSWHSYPPQNAGYAYSYDHRGYSLTPPFAAISGSDHFPGTTPPQMCEEQLPSALDTQGPLKTPDEYASLKPDEGFDSPPIPPRFDSGSMEDIKPASVPDNIYLKSDSGHTPSPKLDQYYESPTSAVNPTQQNDQAPPLPTFHRGETNISDTVNGSSNSSSSHGNHGSHGTSASSSVSDYGWARNYKSLLKYWKEHGNCDVAQKYEGPDGIKLGVWVNKQRMERRRLRNKEKSTMTPDREKRLNDIGFNWGKQKGEASWNEKYNELLAFKQVHGHCRVKTKDKTYKTLGRWVTSQRSDYKNFRMSEERKEKLNEIGFCWDYFGNKDD